MSKKSDEAYIQQIVSGKKQTDASRVYDLLSNYTLIAVRYNTHDVEEILDMIPQTASARVSELADLGIVKYLDGKGRYSKLQVVTDPIEIKRLRRERLDAKILKSIMVLLRYKEHLQEGTVNKLYLEKALR